MDVFSRKNLLVGGAIYEKKKNHIIGDISGLMIQNIPKQFHKYYVPTIAEATQTNWESKLHITATKASQDAEIVLFAGVPTWILTLSKEILKRAEKETLLEVWPQVKAYLHGGVNFDPYRAQFEELLPDKNFLYLEVYNASEGFIAVQDTRENNGLLLLTGHGIYYEFISKDDYNNGDINILNLEEIELNKEYVLLISNISGLYRYVIGDIISFVSKIPFRVQVKGRISDYVNAFGEDLTLEMVNKALTRTLENHNSSIRNYTIAPSYISLNKKGKHQWFIEFEKEPLNLSIFQKDLDEELQSSNFNYYQKRIHNLAMEELEIISLRKDFFDDMAKNLGKFGGQNKLPKLRNDRKLAELILKENKTFKLEEKSDVRIYT